MSRYGKQAEVAKSRKEVGKRITEFYTHELEIDRAEFARVIEVEYNTLRNYENGNSEPGSVFFTKIKEKYPTADISYLFTGIRTVFPGLEHTEKIPMRRIAVVDSIPVGGYPNGVPKSEIIQSAYTTELKNPKVFGLLVRGDSMQPELRDGAVIVLTPVDHPTEGNLYIVARSSGGILYGRVFRTGRNYRIVPHDPNRTPITIKANEAVSFYMGIEIYRRML